MQTFNNIVWAAFERVKQFTHISHTGHIILTLSIIVPFKQV